MTSQLRTPIKRRQPAITEMADDISAMNQRYLNAVRCRALCDAETVNSWQGRTVSVFLRHETDHVFAIADSDLFGMADFVAIERATFRVDEPGRQTACEGNGLLPNGRNIHAFVTGRLLWASMHSICPVPEDWLTIVYNPHRMSTFQVRATGQPILQADQVVFTPDPLLVRCPVPADLMSMEARQ